MNKNGKKVNKAQLMENQRCLSDFQTENLVSPMTFAECMMADRKGKVQKAEGKTLDREESKCDSLDEAPPFAYSSAAAVNAAAVNEAVALASWIFGGPPVLDANLFTKADDKDAATCQFEMLKRAGNLENTVVRELIKVKKKAIKDDSTDSGAALEERLRTVFASSDKISRAEDKLVNAVDHKCDDLQEDPDTLFPGSCSDSNLGVVEACVIAAARCGACLKINAFDGLSLDCDQADDQNANGSCP